MEAAEGGEATVDVINLFKSLPDHGWPSAEAVWRDLGEASRRFGTGNFALEDEGVRRDRSDIGKETVEAGAAGSHAASLKQTGAEAC